MSNLHLCYCSASLLFLWRFCLLCILLFFCFIVVCGMHFFAVGITGRSDFDPAFANMSAISFPS